jgi:importin-4
LLKLSLQTLSDEDPEVYSNGAFAAGLLVENSDHDLSSQYLNILSALQPRFIVADEAPQTKFNARDNAVGAVCRLVLKNTSAVPLDQVNITSE